MKISKFICSLILFNQFAFANQALSELKIGQMQNNGSFNHKNGMEELCQRKKSSPHSNGYQLANVGFSVSSPALWYIINTPAYPSTVPLSLNRNRGTSQGDFVFTDEGLIIGKAGNYSVHFTAIVANSDDAYSPIIPVFLVLNGVFDPANSLTISGVSSLPSGQIISIQGSGILQNVPAGASLSLVATNGGSPAIQPITVISWDINLFRITKDSHHHRRHGCNR